MATFDVNDTTLVFFREIKDIDKKIDELETKNMSEEERDKRIKLLRKFIDLTDDYKLDEEKKKMLDSLKDKLVKKYKGSPRNVFRHEVEI